MTSVSGLVASGTETSQLHHPHQVATLTSPGDRFIQIVDFDSPGWNRNNRVDIPILDMVVDDLWVEFNFPAITGPTTPSLAQVQTWINDNGVQVLYKNQSIYTMTEAEAIVWPKANPQNLQRLQQQLDAMNDVALATRRTRNAGGATYYMWLGPLAKKIFMHAGPISAYASKAWSLIVGLLPLNRVVEGASATAGAQAAGFNMRLICCGHRESAANVQRVADALAGEGVRNAFNQANHIRSAYAAGITSHTVQLTALEGEATDVVIMQRVTAGLTATAPDAVNHFNWVNFDNYADTLEMGTQANPTRVFGLALPIRTIKLLEQGESNTGGPIYVDSEGAARNDSWAWISLCQGSTMGQKFGTYSGALRLKNNFQYIMRFATGTATANTVDTIVYVMRDMLLEHKGMMMINREA